VGKGRKRRGYRILVTVGRAEPVIGQHIRMDSLAFAHLGNNRTVTEIICVSFKGCSPVQSSTVTAIRLVLSPHKLAEIKGAIAELLLRAQPDSAEQTLLAKLKDHTRE